MPIREIDEGSSRIPRQMKRWLREIFIEDWNLKLLALAITLGLWLGVTGQRAPTTRHFRGVQLSFIVPGGMEISNDPPREVEVTLTGSKHEIDRLNARDLLATIDVTDFKPGERVVQLTNRIKLDLPQSVRVDDVEPGAVAMRLEPRIEREVEVEARLEGNLPEGYELRGVNLAPSKVRVRGPASHVNALQKALTETIRLEGLKESYNAPQAAIDIADPKVDLLIPSVSVTLEIGEKRVEKSFAGVLVQTADGAQARPSTASVTLFGPRSLMEQLRPENVRIELDAAPDGSITPRLVLPEGMQAQIELRSIRPTGFSIIR
ncbi:MAG TPA: CdaR family protein [Pyrinomonadaceae bacterium]|jgi:YbbR domain-containing protein